MFRTSSPPGPAARRRGRTALRGLLAALAVLLVGAASLPPARSARSAEAAVAIRLDPGYQQAPFEGWGTALAWFAQVTGGWPEAQRDRLADALYGSDGLGFTVARYNIGGGDSPETAPYMRAGAAVPGHWKRPGPEAPDWWDPTDPAHWDPYADAHQRWWLRAARARGADTFEAFSNSPPYFMTRSGLVSGAADPWQDNLRPGQYERFAAYLVGALRRVQHSTGITFGSLSPVNEPGTGYWRAGGGQEGSHWSPSSQAAMIKALRAELDREGLDTRIAAMDETDPHLFRAHWDSYDGATRAALGRLSTHTYGTGGRTGVRDIAKGTRTPLWMSEVDLGGSVPQSFTDMRPALDLADRITDDLTQLEPRAWVMWQAVEDYENMTPAHENSNWGLIQADFTPADAATEPLRRNKKYWTMAQYSRFVRPGSRVITTDDGDTLAALRPGGQGAVVVHTNSTGAYRTVELDLSAFRSLSPAPVRRYTTDATRNLQRGADVPVSGRQVTVTLAPRSVTTLVIPGASGVDAGKVAPAPVPRLLVSDHSGLALTATATTGYGDPLVQRPAHAADPAQQWTLTRSTPGDWSSTASYRVTNAGSGQVLGVADGRLALLPPGPTAARQWMLSTSGDGHHTLVHAETGMLLDVTGASTTDGAGVGVHRPNTGRNQSWRLAAPS
ncbi:glycoside hydrolase [Streptomyces sp. NPDC047014]|uniref:glycoside hydrolase n=1 Tax=Streptomyces sp. NPDC047014 TaxID=3155736 RepID=UPI0033C727B7